jgi:predicted PurR-regulated permease PerM
MLGVDPKAARCTWTAALVLLLLGIVYLIREALLVFVIALLFAYLLYPLMDLIDRHMTARNMRKTRTPALAVTFLLVLGILAGFGIPLGSVVASEASSLTAQAPALLARIEQPPAPSPSGVKTLKERAIEFTQAQLREHYGDLAIAAPRLGMKILSASGNLLYIVIVPILSFLILRDGRKIRDGFLEMLDSGQQAARDVLADAHELLLSYMRALLFLCCATFVSFSIVLSAMGVPYAVLLASIAFPLEFIPLVGPLSAAVIIIAVSILSGYAHVIWVVVYLGLYRLFQDYVLSPHLMSRGVELHPLMIIFGVFAGGKLGGVAGIFLSIPVLALIRLFYHRARKAQAARHLQPVV